MMGTPLWTASDANAATGGVGPDGWTADGVSIDSRNIDRSDLFVAIKGPRFDGHRFVQSALERGASAAMVDHRPDDVAKTAPLLTVADTERGLEDLGRAARQRSGARIIAITGSVGKTSVKNALKFLLDKQAPTAATEGNLNNQWGLPLSLARMPADTEFGVYEIGMNHPGELTPLSQMVRPHVVVITTVRSIHAEFFNSTHDIAEAKAEIFAGLEPAGTAVLNRDNDYFDLLRVAALAAGARRVIGFGAHETAECRVLDARMEENSTWVRASILGTVFDYRVGIPGRHWITNSLAVLGAIAAAGANIEQAAEDMAGLSASKGRGQRLQIALADGTFTLVDESYNAGPASTAAALETLALTMPAKGGRRIAVLGDMLELGDTAIARHRELADKAAANGIDLVFAAGPMMRHLFDALPHSMQAGYGADSSALEAPLFAAIQPGDVVMIKGSAGSRMGVLVDALVKLNNGAAVTADGEQVSNAV